MARRKKRKSSKDFETKNIGVIPENEDLTNVRMSDVMYIVRYFTTTTMLHKWFKAWAKSTKNKKLSGGLSRVSPNALDSTSTIYGFLLSKENTLKPEHVNRWKAYVKEISTLKPKPAPKPKLPVIKSIVPSALINCIDSVIDSQNFDTHNVSAQIGLTPKAGLQWAAIHYRAQYEEIDELVNRKTKDLVEAYKWMGAKQQKLYLKFLEYLINALTELTVSKARKPRMKKVQSKSKMVQKLKFLEHDTKTGMKSKSPEVLVGANNVWVYNTKSGMLIHYQSTSGISVSGSTIKGFDQVRAKSIRQSALKTVFPDFPRRAESKKNKIFAALTTKMKDKYSGRMSNTCLILSATY